MIYSGRGFLLTRQNFDIANSAHISIWLSTDEGPVELRVVDQKPLFFVRRQDSTAAKQYLNSITDSFYTQLLSHKTFKGEPVTVFYFHTSNAFYQARDILRSREVETFESSVRLSDRYLMERFAYGGIEFSGQVEQASGYKIIHHPKIKPANYSPSFSVLSIDIECNVNGELFSIGCYGQAESQNNDQHQMLSRVWMIGEKQPVNQSHPYIRWVNNEFELLKAFERFVAQFDPDIFIGWNVINFDFKLLIRRAKHHRMSLKLGRNHTAASWRELANDSSQGFVSIDGRVVVDGIAALRSQAYMLPRYSLEYVAQHFLKKGKATEDVDNRLETILHDFQFNKPKLAEYNLQDCRLVWEIFDVTKALDYLIFRAQLTGLELDRAGGSVAAFVNLYLPKIHRAGYVSPNLPKDGGLASPGGYVMDSKPGLYKNILVLDFKSLYPSIIRTFKIDPYGLVQGLIEKENSIPGFKGALFHRDKHFLPEIITELWALRDKAKAANDSARSQAIKILMNSFYGVLGSGGCPFYDTRLASSITLRGHEIMQETAQLIEQKGYQVIYGDTDSTFVLIDENASLQQASKTGQLLAEAINTYWQQTLRDKFQLESYLEIEFETHFHRFLMPTIRGSEQGSKKRYAGLAIKNNQEELIFKGLENVRTDWTKLAQDFQETLYSMLFHDRDPCDYIKQTVQATIAGKNDDRLIYRKRLRRPLNDYVKNIPPHVKAARIAQTKHAERGSNEKYRSRRWVSYVMTLSGPQPVEFQSARLDYQHYIDKQLEPVADAILSFVGLSFKQITDQQLGLFE